MKKIRPREVPPRRLSTLRAIAQLRVARDWTWDQLAADTAAAGFAIPARTLYYLVKLAPPHTRPNERTLYKLRMYLTLRRRQKGRTAAA